MLTWSPAASSRRSGFEHLCHSVDRLMSSRQLRWSADVQTFKMKPREADGSSARQASSGDFMLVSFPAQARLLVQRHERQVLEADGTITAVIEQLGTHTKRATFTFEGIEYIVGDFLVRVGMMKSHGETRGVMLEVEYRPLTCMQLAQPALQEFCQMLTSITESPEGRLKGLDAPFEHYSLPDKFSAQHSAVQYAALVSALNR